MNRWKQCQWVGGGGEDSSDSTMEVKGVLGQQLKTGRFFSEKEDHSGREKIRKKGGQTLRSRQMLANFSCKEQIWTHL